MYTRGGGSEWPFKGIPTNILNTLREAYDQTVLDCTFSHKYMCKVFTHSTAKVMDQTCYVVEFDFDYLVVGTLHALVANPPGSNYCDVWIPRNVLNEMKSIVIYLIDFLAFT